MTIAPFTVGPVELMERIRERLREHENEYVLWPTASEAMAELNRRRKMGPPDDDQQHRTVLHEDIEAVLTDVGSSVINTSQNSVPRGWECMVQGLDAEREVLKLQTLLPDDKSSLLEVVAFYLG